MMEPFYSPWGEIQHCEVLAPHVFSVSAASHGGIMANSRTAKTIFSREALKCAFQEGGFYCFEEDCAAPVALRELMDRGLFTVPVNEYWKDGGYEKCINDSIQRYYPDYWKARRDGKTPPAVQAKQAKEVER